MTHKRKDTGYEAVSPGTMGVAQKVSVDYESRDAVESDGDDGGLVFLARNNIMPCGQNQF